MMTAFRFGSEMSAFNAVKTVCEEQRNPRSVKVCGIDHVVRKMQIAHKEVCDALTAHRNKIGCELGDYIIHNDLYLRRTLWENMISCAKRVDKNEAGYLLSCMEANFDLNA